MSKLTDNSFFMFPPLSKHARFYQELVRGIKSYHQLGNRLIELGEQAHAFRQFEQVKEIGLVLSSIPIKEYQTIGYYFLAVAANKNGNGDQQHAKNLFEVVADSTTGEFKGKAILSLAAVSCNTKDYESQLYYLVETLKTPTDLSTLVRGRLGIAIYKSVEGFHKQSLKDLENLYPLARLSNPIVFFDYLNSLAVELGEAGRKYEARNIIKHVIASPFIQAYPEWQGTAHELKEPNHSFISIPESLPKVERKHVEIEAQPLPTKKERKPADVLPFKKLKEAPEPDKPERVSNIDLDDMTDSEKLDFIMTALRTGAIRPSHYNDIIYQAGMLKAGPASKVIDLEDETVMTDKLIEWAHMIDPEDLAEVISALRDCDDKLRQVNLMDAMIRKLFEYSAACGVSEEAWRKKVERRLPK